MRTVPMNASDEAILEVLEEWTELLAAEDYAGALALLPPDPDQNWTPALLESDVSGYGLPGLTRKEAASAGCRAVRAEGAPPCGGDGAL